MRSHLVVLFLGISMLACKQDGDHLPPAKMKQILYDINAAEAYSTVVTRDSLNRLGRGKNIDSLALYYKEIFTHYNISRQDFDKSALWYKAHPAELDSVYNTVLQQLVAEDTLKK